MKTTKQANHRPTDLFWLHQDRKTLSLMDVQTGWNKAAHILCLLTLGSLLRLQKQSRATVDKFCCTCSALRPVCIAHLVSRSQIFAVVCVSYSMSEEGGGRLNDWSMQLCLIQGKYTLIRSRCASPHVCLFLSLSLSLSHAASRKIDLAVERVTLQQ